MKSSKCSVLNSGLALEIVDLSYTNDESKVTKFIESRNWEYYVNACNDYGFRIDRDAPWRIVMDIGASEVHKISSRYGMYSTPQILNGLYVSAGLKSVGTFGKLLWDLYFFVIHLFQFQVKLH